jgi:hypothetical protein
MLCVKIGSGEDCQSDVCMGGGGGGGGASSWRLNQTGL